jgi:hypothetical protein
MPIEMDMAENSVYNQIHLAGQYLLRRKQCSFVGIVNGPYLILSKQFQLQLICI